MREYERQYVQYLYYNIYANQTEAFLGVVRVVVDYHEDMVPTQRAIRIAKRFLGGDDENPCAPGGAHAVMSTKEMWEQYGLNR